MAKTSACLPKMATNHMYITTLSRSAYLLHKWIALQGGSQSLASVSYHHYLSSSSDHRFPEADDDHDVELIAALEHPDRVHRVDLNITNSGAEEVFAVMQVPFPVLTHLELIGYVNVPVLPGGFLGGSAPCLQHLRIEEVSFPDLPTLLLSARDLVSLRLNCGYISPESMVVGLAELTRLRTLSFVAQPPFPPPEQTRRRPDPPMLAVLPALTQFVFAGDSEYLEDLVAQIDTPRVDDVRIQYFMEEEEAQTPHLSQFIGRLANLKLAQFGRAQIIFHDDNVDNVCIELDRPQGGRRQAHLSITILDGGVDFLVPYVVHDAILSNMGQLSVRRAQVEFGRQDDVDRTEWLPLFHLFPAVETMHVSRSMAGYISSALEDIAEEMVTEVLPALHLLCLEDDDNYDYDSDNIKPVGSTERFLSLRQISGRPVTIVNTRHDFVGKLKAHRTC